MKAVTEQSGSGAAGSREPLPSLELFDSPRAWRMVAAAFVAMCAVYGVAYSFGAFFKPMAAEFGARRSATSAVFSITVLVWCFLGARHGTSVGSLRPANRGRHRRYRHGRRSRADLALIDRLWLGYLTYGLGVGMGVAAHTCRWSP